MYIYVKPRRVHPAHRKCSRRSKGGGNVKSFDNRDELTVIYIPPRGVSYVDGLKLKKKNTKKMGQSGGIDLKKNGRFFFAESNLTLSPTAIWTGALFQIKVFRGEFVQFIRKKFFEKIQIDSVIYIAHKFSYGKLISFKSIWYIFFYFVLEEKGKGRFLSFSLRLYRRDLEKTATKSDNCGDRAADRHLTGNYWQITKKEKSREKFFFSKRILRLNMTNNKWQKIAPGWFLIGGLSYQMDKTPPPSALTLGIKHFEIKTI